MVKWLWKKVEHDPRVDEANEALARSYVEDAIVRSRWPLIRSLADELSALREENNFAARLRAAYGEGR